MCCLQILLQDLMMPDMDGYEVARRLIERTKSSPQDRPKIVALTANTDEETKKKCLEIGMDGIITKPINIDRMRVFFAELLTIGKIVSYAPKEG